MNVRFNSLMCAAVIEAKQGGTARLEIGAQTAHAFACLNDVHGIVMAVAGPIFGRAICAQIPKAAPTAVVRRDWRLPSGVRLALEIVPGGQTRFGASNLTPDKARSLIAPYLVA